MSRVTVEDRATLGEMFGRMTAEERVREVLVAWGCCPASVKALMLKYDAIGNLVNLHSTIRDPQLKERCQPAIERLRAQAPYRLLDHQPERPKVPWDPNKVLDLIERVASSPALPPELEAVYLN